jgi:SAM-dependent methyltransferase
MARYPSTRYDCIAGLIKGKDVLDIGSAGFQEEGAKRFFPFLKEHAKTLVGLDSDKELVRKYAAEGIVYGDAQTYRKEGGFDVVMAGELIEHLSNPGLFLDNTRRNLRGRGIIILTTPNPYSVQNLVRAILFGKEAACKEHVALYSPTVMEELLRRHGFSAPKAYYVQRDERERGCKGRLEHFLGQMRKSFRPRLVFVARKAMDRDVKRRKDAKEGEET